MTDNTVQAVKAYFSTEAKRYYGGNGQPVLVDLGGATRVRSQQETGDYAITVKNGDVYVAPRSAFDSERSPL